MSVSPGVPGGGTPPGRGRRKGSRAGEKAELRNIPPAPGLWTLVGRATQVTAAPFPDMSSGEKLRQEPSQGPRRPHVSTFLPGLGRCQGASGSRVKVGWLIAASPPSEALDGALGTSRSTPGLGRGRSEGARLSPEGRWWGRGRPPGPKVLG